MASIKVLLWDKKNKEGKYPIAIRIIKNRKPTYIYLGHYIDKDQWNEEEKKVRKNHPNSTRLNNLIQKRLSEASDTLLDLEVQKKDTSSIVIKKSIASSNKSSFCEQAKIYIDNLKENGKYNRYSSDEPRVEHFKDFLKEAGLGSDISFQDITIPLLTKFRAYLKRVRSISERTIINHLVVMRSIFSQAITAKVVDKKYYPFGRGGIVIKFPESVKIGLAQEDVKKLEDVELPIGSFENHARNVWLFSFYFAGMRISDVLRLRWSDFQNDRLFYAMGKNAKAGSLKVSEKALKILTYYKQEKESEEDLVFPDLKVLGDLSNRFVVEKKIQNTASRLDKFLRLNVAPKAKINQKLTMHIARHTFGNISGDKIPLQMLQKLYRHSSITTTIGYQTNFIHKDADEALESVIGI